MGSSSANPIWKKEYYEDTLLTKRIINENNVEERYEYDEFGRVKRIYKAGDTEPSYIFEYRNKDTIPGTNEKAYSITIKSRVDKNRYTVRKNFYDGFGRLIFTADITNPDRIKVGADIVYDKQTFLAVKKRSYLPYVIEKGKTRDESRKKYITYSYSNDPLQRLEKTAVIDNGEEKRVTEYDYRAADDKMIYTVSDEEGVRYRYVFDSAGRLIKVMEGLKK